MDGIFILVGVPLLVAGIVTLLRPAWVRAILNMPASEAATYALRIAGMMIAALGLNLAAFAIAYRLSAPVSQGA
jgi:hypothetical protein